MNTVGTTEFRPSAIKSPAEMVSFRFIWAHVVRSAVRRAQICSSADQLHFPVFPIVTEPLSELSNLSALLCVIHSSLFLLHYPHSLIIGCLQVGDGQPMRLWRVSVEIEAPPAVVLQRVLRERHLWDEDLLHSRVIETLENNTEVFHYITDSMAPHPRRNFIVLRYTTPKNYFSLISLILVPHP